MRLTQWHELLILFFLKEGMSYEKNRLRNSDLKDNETRTRNINLSDNSRNWTCLPLFPLKWPSESRQLHEIPLHTHKDAVTKKNITNVETGVETLVPHLWLRGT